MAQEDGTAAGPRQDSFQVTKDMHDLIKSGPGRRTGDVALIDLGKHRRAVEIAIHDGRPVQPDLFAKMLQLAPLPFEKKLEYAVRYTAAITADKAAQCVRILQNALDDIWPAGETITVSDIKLDFSIRASITTHSITVSPVSDRTARDPGASPEFMEAQRIADAQRVIAKGNTFGWITSVGPGFQISAPSRTICRLLDLDYEELNGSFLLSDPLRNKLQAMLGNFGEYALIIGMLTRGALDGWRSDPGYERAAAAVNNFFDWLGWYIKDNYKSVAEQVDCAPTELVDGGSSRNDLQQCMAAAIGRGKWPSYNFNRHNTMRMHIAKHRLLADGVARFAKIAIPFYSGDQLLGYEVTWNAEDADERANQLMRSVLVELGIVES
jgi:hypothetical protein